MMVTITWRSLTASLPSSAVARQLRSLPEPAQGRAVRWLTDRYLQYKKAEPV